MSSKILIVEDDPTIIEMYKEKLKREGFRVSTATDGRKALYKIKQENPDVILLDILMPGLNGFEVLKRLKKQESTKDIPVLVLTNIGSESVDQDKNFAMALGANDYLIKSMNTPEDIVNKVSSIVG